MDASKVQQALINSTIVHEDLDNSAKRTVAIGIDGSEHSQLALEWTFKNILKPDSDLVVLMNVRPCASDAVLVISFGTGYMDNMDSAYVGHLEAEEKSRSEGILKKAVSFLKSCNPKIAIKAFALTGDPREELILKADQVHADIIVVGSRGMGAIKR